MDTIIIIFSFLGLSVVAAVGAWIIIRHQRKRDFDMTPRDRNGNSIEDRQAYRDEDEEEYEEDEVEEDIDDDPAEAPIYDEDLTYDDWRSFEDLLKEVGVIRISNGMIEYETGDNSRMFIMLAEMAQSNPYLKTDEELANNNQVMEVFFNSVTAPLKITSQSQRVEMNDFLNGLKKHSQYLRGTNEQMKAYADQVIEDTLQYQRATDRFENKCYLQFLAIVKPDEVFGDTPRAIEQQVHEKAMEKLTRQIQRANGLLKRADHSLSQLDTFGLVEVLYKTFNRDSSVRIRLEDIVKKQRFTWFTSSHQNDKEFKQIIKQIQIETEAINTAREALIEQQKAKDAEEQERALNEEPATTVSTEVDDTDQ